MSVPAALRAILTLGPAYGLQLHKELSNRLPHRSRTNVGQIYSTLDRLVRDGDVVPADTTDDGLPLYSLTTAGSAKASQWLSGQNLETTTEWVEFIDVFLMASTLPGTQFEELEMNVERVCITMPNNSVVSRAGQRLNTAIRDTFVDVKHSVETGETVPSGLNTIRPMRGRKPKNS